MQKSDCDESISFLRSPSEVDYIWASLVKNPPAVQETQVRSLGWEDPLETGMVTHPVFLPGEIHGQRILEGYTVHGVAESDMTE